MFSLTNISLKTLLSSLLLMAFIAGGTVNAATCKGMSKPACSGESSCSWVDSYQRSDGIKVNGYCRKKSSGKSSGKTLKKEKKATKKSVAKEKKSKS